MRIGLLLACVSIVFIGCSKKSHPEDPAHFPLQDSLEAEMEKNYKSKIVDTCDLAIKDKMLAMARDLDQRKAQIAGILKSVQVDSADKKFVEFGGNNFYLYREPPESQGRVQTRFSWTEILERYEKVKATNKGWVGLNSIVRDIVVEDVMRLRYFRHPQVTPTNAALFDALDKKVSECLKNKCYDLSLTPQEEYLLQQGKYHSRMLQFYRDPYDEKEKFMALDNLAWRLENEARRFRFTRNARVRQTAKGHFVLPMNEGSFAGDSSKFHLFMDIWSDANHRVVLESSAIQQNDLFRFVFKPIIDRAYVDVQEKTVNLFAGDRVSTISHELGHVLGFRDSYFITWKPEECTYVGDTAPNDLMAVDYSGNVLPEHWKKLNEEYPLAN